MARQLTINRPEWGPWIGVPEDKQDLCAVEGCTEKGLPHSYCPGDGGSHHHGCVHYDCRRVGDSHGLTFRKGWGWLCQKHYGMVCKAATPLS